MTTLTIAIVLTLAVAVVLLVLGFLLGARLGGRLAARPSGPTLDRLRETLAFEREQRLRLTREHFEASQKLSRMERELKSRQSPGETSTATAADGELRAEIDILTERNARLKGELSLRKERIVDLEVELSMLQEDVRAAGAAPDPDPPARISRIDLSGTTVGEILAGLIELEGVRQAVVADNHGLVVEAIGGTVPAELLAAASGHISEMGPRLDDILPLGSITSVSVADEDDLVLEARYFRLYDVRCSLLILREAQHSYPRLALEAVQAIVTSLED